MSYINDVKFEWDAKKAVSNFSKRGVSFEEAVTAFDDTLAAYYPEKQFDDRLILIGYSHKHRVLYVVYAEITLNTVRIISARKATSHEKARYEND